MKKRVSCLNSKVLDGKAESINVSHEQTFRMPPKATVTPAKGQKSLFSFFQKGPAAAVEQDKGSVLPTVTPSPQQKETEPNVTEEKVKL